MTGPALPHGPHGLHALPARPVRPVHGHQTFVPFVSEVHTS